MNGKKVTLVVIALLVLLGIVFFSTKTSTLPKKPLSDKQQIEEVVTIIHELDQGATSTPTASPSK